MAISSNAASSSRRSGFDHFLRTGFWTCVVIAVLVVIRRMIALGSPGSSDATPFASLDTVFASHTALTLAHIVPALCFVLLTPLIVFGRGRLSHVLEKPLFPLGVVVGGTAYAMSVYSIGGWIERSAVLVFDSYFLFCLGRAWIYASQHRSELKRRWLLRGIATLLGIATTRPVMGLFFATSTLTHWKPDQFFGVAFWIGFSVNVVLFELWNRAAGQHRASIARSAR